MSKLLPASMVTRVVYGRAFGVPIFRALLPLVPLMSVSPG